MENQLKMAAGLHMFGSTADRYVLSGYKPQVPLPQMIEAAATVPDLTGVELVETWHINSENSETVLGQLERAGLKLSMLIPDLWASGKYGMGSFTSNEKKIREESVATVKRAMDMAESVGCNLVDVWLGQDGYDYPFQADYMRAWEMMIEGLRECADHNKNVTVGMEYKIKEPRTHCFIGGIGKQMLLFDAVKRDNLGIVLDVGHSLESYESMAESAVLSKMFGDRLVYLHLNDNWRLWDDDMMVGSVHTIELLELLYWLERIEYSGWYSLDIFPYRDDAVGLATESFNWIRDLRAVIRDVGMSKIEEVITGRDQAKTSKLIREAMLKRS